MELIFEFLINCNCRKKSDLATIRIRYNGILEPMPLPYTGIRFQHPADIQ